MVAPKVEKEGIIRHGANMLHAGRLRHRPQADVVLRKGYGAGYYVMNGRAYEPDALLAWPGAEISVMGAEGWSPSPPTSSSRRLRTPRR